MKNKNRYVSRTRTPWDNSKTLSPLEYFIKDKYLKTFEFKHPKINEEILLNSFEVTTCKHCKSSNIKKNGFTKNGIQRYFCKDCHKTFNILTNTIFDNHKISISEWIEFLLYLFGYESIQEISKSNKNSTNTTKFWIKKLFLVLQNYQNEIMLNDKIWLDETYFKVIKKDIKVREDNKEFRGLSNNQICIGVATDGFKVYAKVEGFGKTNETRTLDTFEKHIRKNSHLIHDKEKSHNILIENLSLTHTAYDGNVLKTLEDKFNPLDPINKVINSLQKFLKSHPGFKREELQGYLDLFVFMKNEKGAPLEKVKRIVYLSLVAPVSLKYREYFCKKSKIGQN